MKKRILQFTVFLFLFSFVMLPVLATTTPKGIDSAFDLENNKNLDSTLANAGYQHEISGEKQLDNIIGTVLTLGFSVIGIVFIIIIIVAGIQYMVSSGNQEKVSEAKSSIKSGIIGLVVVLAAYAISWFVINLLVADTLK